MESSSIDYKKLVNELLNIDRQDSERFHEDFVRIIVDYGFDNYLTLEEKQWYEDNKNDYCQNIGEYILFA
ncbi:MAG: hypothetical protein LBT27_08460 [Prevotellaceae bacterium]|jgi:hypothetical protein|nr:hypothetical protein [Prevotellaceae bacterium]